MKSVRRHRVFHPAVTVILLSSGALCAADDAAARHTFFGPIGVSETGNTRKNSQGDLAGFDLERTKAILRSEIKATLKDTGIPSISIALLKRDRIIWAEAFGYSNVKLKVPASPRTIYGTGSCLKPVTAMAVMQLVDKGKLKLDDPINKYLGDHAVKDLSGQGKPVTVRHLLGHYSGLTVDFETVPLEKRKLPRTLEQLASVLKAEGPPGVRYRYSNSGYALAGLLVQKVSRKTYERYLVENILRPLGIRHAGPINPTPEMIEELALPYRLENRRAVPVARHRYDVYPAGDAYLSVPAMARILLTHLNAGKLNDMTILSAASVREMQKRQFGGRDGLDFGIRMLGGEKLIMHGGGVPGYSTKFIVAVDSKVGVYIAANAGRAQTPNRILAQRALDLLRGKKLGTGMVRQRVGLGFVPAVDRKSGTVRIKEVFPRSPASRAGLSPADAVRKVNGVSVAGKSLKEFLLMIGGPAGKGVKLELVDSNRKQRTVTLTRQKFLMPG